jgi:hypothetical protein
MFKRNIKWAFNIIKLKFDSHSINSGKYNVWYDNLTIHL